LQFFLSIKNIFRSILQEKSDNFYKLDGQWYIFYFDVAVLVSYNTAKQAVFYCWYFSFITGKSNELR